VADLTISGTVKKVTGANGTVVDRGVAGATITQGQTLYKDTSDAGKLKLADADFQATAVLAGIALHGAVADQPIEYAMGGLLDLGTTVVAVGTYYTASATAGGICPVADLASGDYCSGVGWGVTTTRIEIRINVSDVAKA